MSRERPILFNGDMVRAILEGRKTQTRRVVKPLQLSMLDVAAQVGECQPLGSERQDWSYIADFCPYGAPGDRLWVRETWQGPLIPAERMEEFHEHGRDRFQAPEFCAYRASGDSAEYFDVEEEETVYRWRPSIHMPRWASRITLEVVDVRVERLQDVGDDDATAEGVEGHYIENGWYWRDYRFSDDEASCGPMLQSAKDSFNSLWESINGPGSWAANPWVWVVEFRRLP